ncbi:HEAT repeat protein [Azospirillum lipoferum]|uniref:HEAT repeat domain-containing protein n=1 Tax=Azospirillum lipoferum TaxID=193 RepID=A0A5A9GGD2_AZOLI|nr:MULTISPECIES: HEAT repeat domain-containing protein [Azospirillum]KAA0592905.1 HEAT repeat domain-containing protein [Azospirillum lipoferum]MCP1614048.1 HEAT repeat protein [Azospirillum lipoferum]MDW5537562.1 HEAT repeat domain-containing protein [Azospirillum sp. NL1]
MGLVKKKAAPETSPAGPTGSEAARDPLAALEDADAAVRRGAAHALGHAVVPGAEAALARRLQAEGDAGVREAILTALARIATPDAAAALVPFLDREDAALRNAALESLQQMPAEVAAPALLPLLDHADADLRIFAVQGLGSLVHPGDSTFGRADWLARVMERDADVNVCLAAVEALAEAGSPEALSSLETLARRFPGDAFVAFAVDAARSSFRGG